MTEPEQPPAVWVMSDVDLAGTYRVTVAYNEDFAVVFDQADATAYATELFAAAAYAEYDAAVVAQSMKHFGMTLQEAGAIVFELRKDRPALDQVALGALTVAPGVAAATGAAFLACGLDQHPLTWQWTPAEVNEHASFVMRCYPTANLDAAYRRMLVSSLGLDDAVARAVVSDLQHHRSGR